MPAKCTVCNNSKRQEIDKLLINGESIRAIASQYSLNRSSLQRHNKNHIPKSLIKSKQAEEVTNADKLLFQLKNLQEKTMTILARAEEADDLRTSLVAIREARSNLELLAKLLGELNESQTVNILVAPEWIALRTKILNALDEHPEAKISVSRALEGLNGSDS